MQAIAKPLRLFAIRSPFFGNKKYPVESVEDARNRWEALREQSGLGCSVIGNGVTVVDEQGEFIASISYNGRVWYTKQEIP